MNFIFLKMLITSLPKELFARYTLLNSYFTFPQAIVISPILGALLYFYSSKKDCSGYTEIIIKAAFKILLYFSLCTFSLLLFIYFLSPYPSIQKTSFYFHFDEVFIVALCLCIQFFTSILDQVFLGEKLFLEFSGLQFFGVTLKVLFISILLFSNMITVSVFTLNLFVLFSLIITSIIYFLILGKRKIVFSYSNKVHVNLEIKRILFYSAAPMVWGPFQFLLFFSDRFSVNYNLGLVQLAIYTAYFQIAFTPIQMLTSIISQYLAPQFYSFKSNSELCFQGLIKSLRVLIVCSLLLIPVFLCSNFGIRILLDNSFLKWESLFPILYLAGTFFAVGQIAAIPFQSSSFPIRLLFPKISMSIIAFLLSYFMAIKIGLLGAALGVLISCLYYMVYLLTMLYRDANYSFKELIIVSFNLDVKFKKTKTQKI